MASSGRWPSVAARSAWVWPLVVVIALAIGLQLLTAPRLDMEGTIREGLERFGQADEFGKLCAFLASAHAGYITGQNILIDGGAFRGSF